MQNLKKCTLLLNKVRSNTASQDSLKYLTCPYPFYSRFTALGLVCEGDSGPFRAGSIALIGVAASEYSWHVLEIIWVLNASELIVLVGVSGNLTAKNHVLVAISLRGVSESPLR